MAEQCKQCGRAFPRRTSAIFCWGCSTERRKIRQATSDRKRPGVFAPIKTATGWACVDCQEALPPATYGGRRVRPALRCAACVQGHGVYLDILSGRQLNRILEQYVVAELHKHSMVARVAGRNPIVSELLGKGAE